MTGSITVAKFRDVANGLQEGQFAIGDRVKINGLSDLDPIYKPLEASRNWIKAAGWKALEIKSGHDAMVIAPDRLADMLDADAV